MEFSIIVSIILELILIILLINLFNALAKSNRKSKYLKELENVNVHSLFDIVGINILDDELFSKTELLEKLLDESISAFINAKELKYKMDKNIFQKTKYCFNYFIVLEFEKIIKKYKLEKYQKSDNVIQITTLKENNEKDCSHEIICHGKNINCFHKILEDDKALISICPICGNIEIEYKQ